MPGKQGLFRWALSHRAAIDPDNQTPVDLAMHLGKVAVLGMRERGGRTHAMVIPDTGLSTIQNEIHGAVESGTQLYTDEHSEKRRWKAPTPTVCLCQV